MKREELIEAMDKLIAQKEERGVKQRGGKLYTMVQDRVEAFRRVAGTDMSIVTEILHYSPTDDAAPIVMKASIKNGDNVIAVGHAEEWRGTSLVTQTSALEVCETSAIGRALASLGLHGGEFASANEIDSAIAKEAYVKAPPEKVPGKKVKVIIAKDDEIVAAPVVTIPAVPKIEVDTSDGELVFAAFNEFIKTCVTVEQAREFWARNASVINALKIESPETYSKVLSVFKAHKENIEKEAVDAV